MITTEFLEGVVSWFNEVKGYGFIKCSAGTEYFVHYKEIAMQGFKKLKDGQRVSFTKRKTDKGWCAENVTVIPD
jgi:CspA family cold shock protein